MSEPRYRGYLVGALAVGAASGASFAVRGYLQISELAMLHLLALVLVSMRFGIGPSVFTAALMSLSFDFFFLPPLFSLWASDAASAVTLATMCFVAAVISGLGEQTRRQREAVRAKELQIETERLRTSLLSAVSHDLRTPLATIVGAGTELLRDGEQLGAAERGALARSIVEESERLDQLVTNLLDVTRLDSGSVRIQKRLEPLDEVVEAALQRLQGRLESRVVRTHVPEDVPLVPMDRVLLQQVFVNLLENAIRHTPEGTGIDIRVKGSRESVSVELADQGPGLRGEDPEELLAPFRRGRSTHSGDGGLGLGLAICRAIIESHQGKISIADGAAGGTVVRFVLPTTEGARAS